MMRNFNYQDDPLYVTPNGRGNGLYLKLQNKMGLGWQVEAEFYGRQNEAPEVRPDQVIDDILLPYVDNFPYVPFPNVNAVEFQLVQQNPQQQMVAIQPPVVAEHEANREIRQDFENNGQDTTMSADTSPIRNLPIEPPRENMVQDENVVQNEPITIQPMPLSEALPLIDEVLNEEDNNVHLIFVEEHIDLDQMLN